MNASFHARAPPCAGAGRVRFIAVTARLALVGLAGAPGVAVGPATVLAGTTSWADRSLVRDGSFYPSRTLGAAQRLAYYASRLPMTEVATTSRFPPTPDVARRWAASTPSGFTMDVQAWALLTGAPTWPGSLWPDLQGHVRPSRREGAKLYRHRLPDDVVDECWARFVHALGPLVDAGRMGAVVLRYPAWFSPRASALEELAGLPGHLDGLRGAVELTNDKWFEGDRCEQTLGLLEQLGLGFVCRDRPGPGRPVVAATSDWAFVRFPGRRTWARPEPPAGVGGEEGQEQAGPAWWSYRYSDEELAGWVPAVRDLASGTSQVHLVMDNCWRADAVDNAARIMELVAGNGHPRPSPAACPASARG